MQTSIIVRLPAGGDEPCPEIPSLQVVLEINFQERSNLGWQIGPDEPTFQRFEQAEEFEIWSKWSSTRQSRSNGSLHVWSIWRVGQAK